MPKSASLTTPLRPTSTLSDLKARCSKYLRCIKASAMRHCLQTYATLSSPHLGKQKHLFAEQEPPTMYSIEIHTESSSAIVSPYCMMLPCSLVLCSISR